MSVVLGVFGVCTYSWWVAAFVSCGGNAGVIV